MMLIAAATVAGLLLLIYKIFGARALDYDILIDVILSIFIILAFASTGSFIGMATGALSGVMVSAILFGAKKALGYNKHSFTWNKQRRRFEKKTTFVPGWFSRADTFVPA